MEINNCVALVTGGASGLGAACVRQFVADGAKVAVLDLAVEAGETLAVEFGAQAIFCKTDVSDEDSVKAAVDKAVETFGALHIAVSCAGIGIPGKVIGKKGLYAMDKFNRTMAINLGGTMNVIRLVAEKMLLNEPNADGEKGVLINTASIAAFDGQIGQAAYSASKAAIVGMTLPIAREFADYGIRIMTIAPGLFNTPMLAGLPEKAKASLVQMVPFPKRLGEPAEFAKMAKHIVENPILNGETIRLDSAIRMAAK